MKEIEFLMIQAIPMAFTMILRANTLWQDQKLNQMFTFMISKP